MMDLSGGGIALSVGSVSDPGLQEFSCKLVIKGEEKEQKVAVCTQHKTSVSHVFSNSCVLLLTLLSIDPSLGHQLVSEP
jgi:hypothetical protein